MEANVRRVVSFGRLFGVLVVLVLFGVFASSAAADTVAIQQSPASPVVGESVTFTAPASSDCPKTYTFTVDGTALPPQAANNITETFSSAGTHNVSVDIPAIEGCAEITGSDTFTVYADLTGSIGVSPDPPVVNQPATLTATQSGGSGNYTYSWDLNDDGTYGDSTDRQPTTTFTTTGPHVVKVKIDDDSGHEVIVQRTLDVQSPSTTTTTTTTPPPPCVSKLDFQLSEFKTPGCFTQVGSSPATYTTTSAVTLNGITFPDFGQTFTVTSPSAQDPGGHFTAPDSVIRIGSLKVFSGNIDWSLPAGIQGDEQPLKTFSVSSGAQLFGLSLAGSVSLNLGWDSGVKGLHYASFGLNFQLPAGFSAGPDPSFGSVTGGASLRVDDAGIHYNGLQIEADNVWIGKLKVDQVCFSYIPAGGQTISPCAPPMLDGSPYITCASDVNTDRWNGNATIELPGSGITLAAFGGLAGGQVSELGGFVDNLGRKAPLAPNVYLNRVGLGLCLNPPPFTLRGDVGIAIFPTTGDESLATINGHVIYTNSYPWTLEIGGSVNVLDNQVGTGSVLIDGWGDFAFDLAANIDLYGAASIAGDINGWVDPPSQQYAVSGSVNACISGIGCAMGSGVVSSTGVAGCISITSTYQSPDLVITLGSPPTIGFANDTIDINAGVGYRWGASWPDIFADSCDLSSYQPTRPFAGVRAARAGVIAERIAAGTTALAWRIHGSHGIPKVIIHGPHGVTIRSSANGPGAQRKGHWMLAENPANGTTNVLLIHPAAGTWNVQALSGTASLPTKIDQAKFEAPPTLAAGVRAHGTKRTLEMAYAVPPGASVRLIEHGKGVNRALVRSVHGKRCHGAPANRPGSDEKVLCFTLRFQPAAGPAGLRKIEALVSKNGVPIVQKDIASFHAAALKLPTRPLYLLARRIGGNLRVAFTPSSGAVRYIVSATLSDGRKLAYDLKANCQAVQVSGVSPFVSAKVKIAGMRFDEALGSSRSVSIKAGAKSVVPKGKLPKTLKSPKRVCD